MNLEELARDFIFVNEDWFQKKYANKSDGRYATFKVAMNWYLQHEGKVIVETGCVRQQQDFGAGMSTLLFCEFLKKYGGHLWSIDITERHLKICAEITKDFEAQRTLILDDSVAGISKLKDLKDFPGKIDLLYLDSFDYPYFELCNLYGGKTDMPNAMKTLGAMTDTEVVEKHGEMFKDCQDHTLKELMVALPLLHDKSIILIDDNNLAGGGKSRVAKNWLLNNGYICLFDYQQTLWIKRV